MTSQRPNDDEQSQDYEPLLGQPGDQMQTEDKPLWWNIFTGTAIIAQAGIWMLFATVWAAVFMHGVILFSWHPLMNSLALLFGIQAVLVLQPTHTPTQKRTGAVVHGSLNAAAFAAYLTAFVIIYYNKAAHNGAHFASAHARLGLLTYIVLLGQAVVGFTMYATPGLYGSVDRAKSIWKYHRMSGYAVVTLALATVCAATTTGYNKDVLSIGMSVMVVSGVLILAGVVPRAKLQKLGIKPRGQK